MITSLMSLMGNKGQTRVVGEMLLFAVGVLILGYILITFGTVQSGVNEVSRNDQLRGVADYIKSTVAKAINSGADMTTVFELPLKISGEDYGIELKSDKTLHVFILSTPDVAADEGLFNTRTDYNIENALLRSSGRYYFIELKNKRLKMDYYKLG